VVICACTTRDQDRVSITVLYNCWVGSIDVKIEGFFSFISARMITSEMRSRDCVGNLDIQTP